jgi:hypothetical protein
VVSKCQIAFESPASERDFASDFQFKALSRSGPMKKRSPPHVLAGEYFEEVCNAAIPPEAD